jgi:hypothetical protein
LGEYALIGDRNDHGPRTIGFGAKRRVRMARSLEGGRLETALALFPGLSSIIPSGAKRRGDRRMALRLFAIT